MTKREAVEAAKDQRNVCVSRTGLRDNIGRIESAGETKIWVYFHAGVLAGKAIGFDHHEVFSA